MEITNIQFFEEALDITKTLLPAKNHQFLVFSYTTRSQDGQAFSLEFCGDSNVHMRFGRNCLYCFEDRNQLKQSHALDYEISQIDPLKITSE